MIDETEQSLKKRIELLEAAIENHNHNCLVACGLGDLEASKCG